MGTWHDADFLPAVFLSGFPLNNDRPVEVLTALCGQPNTVFGQHRCDAGVNSLCSLKARVLADVAADDLAGRAAHHKDIALFQLCLLQQLRDRLDPTPEGKVACSALVAEAERMSRTTLEQRMNVYGADFAGVDSLLPAVLMTEMIARSLNLNDVIIPGSGYDEEFSSSLIRAEQHPGDLEAEVLHFAGILADRYKADKGHREHVARLCMEMFDQLQDLHRLSEHDRLLLEVASILHEVGSFISQQDHQLHSQYIILNSEIFGLSRDDVETIALLARYHRHEVPANSDPMYGELELTDRMRVAKMAAILRVADALERGHAQRVNGVRARIRGRMLELELQGVRETAVEDLALRLKGDLFADIFGYDVVLVPQR